MPFGSHFNFGGDFEFMIFSKLAGLADDVDVAEKATDFFTDPSDELLFAFVGALKNKT